MKHRQVYFAGPLFSIAERSFNIQLAKVLSLRMPHITFMLPQQYAEDISGQEDFLDKMFAHCIECINQADAVLCVLDGADADSGTCVEMGYAYAKGVPIVGIRTDFRSLEDKGLNLMVSRVCQSLLWRTGNSTDLHRLADEITVTLNEVLALEK